MVAMAVGEDQILHLGRVEAQFSVTSNDDALRFLGIVQAVDLDDACAGHDRPGGDAVRSEVVQLIEYLGGRRVGQRSAAGGGVPRRHAAVHEIAGGQVVGGQKPRIFHVRQERHRVRSSGGG